MAVVSDENVLRILPLAEEYQMHKLKVDCETCMLLHVERETRPKEGVIYLIIAQTYNLIRLRDRSADLASKLQLDHLEQMPEFNDLDSTNQIALLKVWEHLLSFCNMIELHCSSTFCLFSSECTSYCICVILEWTPALGLYL